jgi:hypothetical protein|tara:strand:+ start:102 stop:356 length:255 start_codon:yes stop_codon:yes gene_type:complete
MLFPVKTNLGISILQIQLICKIDSCQRWIYPSYPEVTGYIMPTINENVKGVIAGSDPIDGPYMPNSYLSWATNIFLRLLYYVKK